MIDHPTIYAYTNGDNADVLPFAGRSPFTLPSHADTLEIACTKRCEMAIDAPNLAVRKGDHSAGCRCKRMQPT